MTSSQFYALMIARRAMGDLSREVELTDSEFDELVETSRGKSEPINPFEVRSNGYFQLNSCNGPTLIFRSGMRPELYFKYRATSSTTKTAERDKTTEEVIAARFQRYGELKHLHTIDESGRRNASERLLSLEKWRSEDHILNLSNRIAALENQAQASHVSRGALDTFNKY